MNVPHSPENNLFGVVEDGTRFEFRRRSAWRKLGEKAVVADELALLTSSTTLHCTF